MVAESNSEATTGTASKALVASFEHIVCILKKREMLGFTCDRAINPKKKLLPYLLLIT